MNRLFNLAATDFKRGFSKYRLWFFFGWIEVLQRYRRSILGPWWISLSMLLFVVMMGLVFSRLFHQELSTYVAFFTAGFLFWSFISTSITESVEIFKSSGAFIKQINLPYSFYVFKHLIRQSILFLHNSLVYVLVCLYFKKNPGPAVFLVVPGLCLLLINLYWMCFIVAMLSARYRDTIPMVNSCMQIAFLVTPISWMSNFLTTNSPILRWNPLVYLLDIVRSPLLGHAPDPFSCIVSAGMAIAGSCLCFAVFSFARSRIVFWVD